LEDGSYILDQEKQATFIVINDSDSDEAEEVKPDVDELNQAIQGNRPMRVVTCTTASQTKTVEISHSDFSEKDITKLVPIDQMDFIIKQDKIIKETKEKLTKLRSNVSKLLAFIDNILIEMIKVNSQT
jgi:hypothetical protein